MQLGKLIERAVDICGSQQKLAERIGTQRGHISEWKDGKRPCPDKHIIAMAQITGCKPVNVAIAIYRRKLKELVNDPAR